MKIIKNLRDIDKDDIGVETSKHVSKSVDDIELYLHDRRIFDQYCDESCLITISQVMSSDRDLNKFLN